MKRCRSCNVVKLLADFYAHPTATLGRRPDCKSCRNKSEVERRRGSSRARRLARDASQRWRYKIEPNDRAALFAAQGDRCAICGGSAGRMVLDHDHSTGKVRGILCDPCNLGIGKFREDPAVLAEAIRYLGSPLPNDLYPLLKRDMESIS